MFVKAPDGPDGIPLATIGVEPIPVTIDEDPSAQPEIPMATEATPLVGTFSHDDDYLKQEETDKPVFRDFWFGLLFLAHLGVMIWLAAAYGTFTIDDFDLNVTNWRNYMDDDSVDAEQFQQFEKFVQDAQDWAQLYPIRILTYVAVPSALAAYAVSYLLTALVYPACPTAVVVFTLLGSFGITVGITIAICVASSFEIGALIVCGLILVGVIYYIRIVWRLIPFASINLNVALQGISANCGMYLVAFLFSIAGCAWTIFWLYIVIGVLQALNRHYEATHPLPPGMSKKEYVTEEQDDPASGFAFFGFLISLYWTSKIILNTIQVTTAGVMATWCYVRTEAQSCCSPGVYSSLYRSMTYSFGSICMGSLLQAFITAIRVTIESARNRNDGNSCEGCGAFVVCILECIAKCLEDILEYFNQWAFVYVGIYGYSYLTSGRKVVELFKARGFTAFVTNDLVGYVLGFTNVVVGILTGLIAVLVQSQVDKKHAHDLFDSGTSYVYGPTTSTLWISMAIGFLIGAAVSSIMMNVIRGAVNTLIVCFADDPAKLEDNHPELTLRMAQAWGAAFPDAGLASRPLYSVVV